MNTIPITNRWQYINHVDTVFIGLNVEQYESYCNGVGSKHWLLEWAKVPPDIEATFRTASDFHDVAYWLGGTAQQRAWADCEFFARIMEAAYSFEGNYFSQLRLRAWAQLCQLAVRLAGDVTWEHRDNPLERLP